MRRMPSRRSATAVFASSPSRGGFATTIPARDSRAAGERRKAPTPARTNRTGTDAAGRSSARRIAASTARSSRSTASTGIPRSAIAKLRLPLPAKSSSTAPVSAAPPTSASAATTASATCSRSSSFAAGFAWRKLPGGVPAGSRREDPRSIRRAPARTETCSTPPTFANASASPSRSSPDSRHAMASEHPSPSSATSISSTASGQRSTTAASGLSAASIRGAATGHARVSTSSRLAGRKSPSRPRRAWKRMRWRKAQLLGDARVAATRSAATCPGRTR